MMKNLKFALLMSSITTLFVSLVLVVVNLGFTDDFIKVWLRTWLIAFVLVTLSILFLAPVLRKFLDKF
jgi:hypothetical protein